MRIAIVATGIEGMFSLVFPDRCGILVRLGKAGRWARRR